jgi:hypothetical protein
MSKRKLFCEISPVTYKISALKCRISRYLKDIIKGIKFARVKQNELLPVVIYSHKSLIRRRLGNVNMELQENKAVNLKIASAKVSHIVIKPGEVFSFWHLVGDCTEKEGYKKGLTISNGGTSSGIGGGMCQFTNLIHWIVLHTPMKIVEHHHHNGFDLFHRAITFVTKDESKYLNDIHQYIGKEIQLKERPAKETVNNLKQEFSEKIFTAPEIKETKGVQLNKEIMKLHINAGKKTKMRPVDIVGTLCNIKGMTAADIGIINILDVSTFVEILNNKGELVFGELQKTPVKGRLRKVSKAAEDV